jgi:hypothetical protein
MPSPYFPVNANFGPPFLGDTSLTVAHLLAIFLFFNSSIRLNI